MKRSPHWLIEHVGFWKQCTAATERISVYAKQSVSKYSAIRNTLIEEFVCRLCSEMWYWSRSCRREETSETSVALRSKMNLQLAFVSFITFSYAFKYRDRLKSYGFSDENSHNKDFASRAHFVSIATHRGIPIDWSWDLLQMNGSGDETPHSKDFASRTSSRWRHTGWYRLKLRVRKSSAIGMRNTIGSHGSRSRTGTTSALTSYINVNVNFQIKCLSVGFTACLYAFEPDCGRINEVAHRYVSVDTPTRR